MSDPDHVRLMEAVARHFFGAPNRRLSKKGELRFGTRGSLSIDLEKAAWFDHEANEGGGPLDLIKRETGISEQRDCYAWAEREGYWSNGHARDFSNGAAGGRRSSSQHRSRAASRSLSMTTPTQPASCWFRSAAIRNTILNNVGRTAAAVGFTASKACGWCRIACRRWSKRSAAGHAS